MNIEYLVVLKSNIKVLIEDTEFMIKENQRLFLHLDLLWYYLLNLGKETFLKYKWVLRNLGKEDSIKYDFRHRRK